MTRPVRIDIRDGWYHVLARGLERHNIYLADCDFRHFLELLAAMVDRYKVRIHAYVLMGEWRLLKLTLGHFSLARFAAHPGAVLSHLALAPATRFGSLGAAG